MFGGAYRNSQIELSGIQKFNTVKPISPNIRIYAPTTFQDRKFRIGREIIEIQVTHGKVGPEVKVAHGKEVRVAQGKEVRSVRGKEARVARGKEVRAVRGKEARVARSKEVRVVRGKEARVARGKAVAQVHSGQIGKAKPSGAGR